MSPATVLVTGGAGLIGLEVCRRLDARGIHVNLLDLQGSIDRVHRRIPERAKQFAGSVLEADTVRRAASGCDCVIHLAAMLGVERTEKDRLGCLRVNVDGTHTVLQAAAEHSVQKFIFASSSEVYGEPDRNPVDETAPTCGGTVYAVSKLAGEQLCRAYAQSHGLQYCILRYFNCYGPAQTAQFVVPRFIRSVMAGRPPVVYGDGRQTRAYSYVSDTAEATVLAALSNRSDGEVLNIGGRCEPISLVDLATMIGEIGSQNGALVPEIRGHFQDSDRMAEREFHNRWCCSKKMENLLNWQPEVDLKAGIRKVIEDGLLFEDWAGAV